MSLFPLPLRRTALRLLPLAAVLALAPAVYADSFTYNVALSPTSGAYGGNGTITVDSAPSSSGTTTYSTANGQLQGLSFTIDNQTFSLAGDSGASVQFLNGQLYNISFAQTVGSSPNRFTLDTSGVYAFYYNNGQSESSGNMTATLAETAGTPASTTPSAPSTSPTPEPGSLLLLATALIAGGFLLFRHKRTAES